jgi:hypothetical protein
MPPPPAPATIAKATMLVEQWRQANKLTDLSPAATRDLAMRIARAIEQDK